MWIMKFKNNFYFELIAAEHLVFVAILLKNVCYDYYFLVFQLIHECVSCKECHIHHTDWCNKIYY